MHLGCCISHLAAARRRDDGYTDAKNRCMGPFPGSGSHARVSDPHASDVPPPRRRWRTGAHRAQTDPRAASRTCQSQSPVDACTERVHALPLQNPPSPSPETASCALSAPSAAVNNLLRDSGPGGGAKNASRSIAITVLVAVALDKTGLNPTRNGVGICADAGACAQPLSIVHLVGETIPLFDRFASEQSHTLSQRNMTSENPKGTIADQGG